MSKRALLGILLIVVACGSAWAEDVARPREAVLNLPAAWKAVAAQDRLAAERVAAVDADRLLVERIYGLRINAETLVLDLALAHDEIRGCLDTLIKGIRTKEVQYKDDLTVEVVKEVTIREVIETIERTIKKEKTACSVKVEEFEKISRETRDTVVGAMGNGAVPGSVGHKKILAKRAAEMDCYRKIAERVMGVRVSSASTIHNLAVDSDQIQTRVAACLSGVKFTDITYLDDGSCRVSGRLILRDVIETVERTYKKFTKPLVVKEEEWEKVRTETKDKVIEEVGQGAPRAEGAEPGPVATSGPGVYSFQREVIRRVIRREVGPVE